MSTSSTVNPYWRCETDERAGAVNEGRRCQVCGYSLAGLPDREGEIQCPECGQVGSFVEPPLSGVVAFAAVMAGIISVLNGLVAAVFLVSAWGAKRYGYPTEVAIQSSIAVGLIYVGVAVWFVPGRRFAFTRWVAALSGASLVVYCIGELKEEWHAVPFVMLVYGAVVFTFLTSPEAASACRKLLRRIGA